MPHTNKVWTLFGFELFAALPSGIDAEVIEVYPYAIVRSPLPTCPRKPTAEGYLLSVIASRTGWLPSNSNPG